MMKNKKGWNVEIKVREKYTYRKDRERKGKRWRGENS